ncbi:hypothetical protein [Nocardia vaccinii]|uniref:hypothetical protein n=1 Tax=Nocardia vaccinii TaxID=1822 RepID=UPI0012F4D6BC|nr:hypothetical protein [Nocardia vaccinii]
MKTMLSVGLIATAAVSAVICPPLTTAANAATESGTCTLNATANISPGLTTASQSFTVTFDGTLSHCAGASPNTPPSGQLIAGLDGAPVPNGTGSCESNTVNGYSINKWSDGNTTVVKFSATGTPIGLDLTGQVVDGVSNGSTQFTTTEPTTPVGSAVKGAIAFVTNPLNCLPGQGVTTAQVAGQLTHTN